MLNRKGDATDVFVILIILAFLSISFIVGIFVNTQITGVITDTSLNDTDISSDIVSALNTANVTTVQRGFAFILAILIIFTILSAFLVRQHPAFIFVNILILLVTMFTAVFVGNIYGSLQDNSILAPIMAQQTIITFIMTHIVTIIMAVGGLNMLVLFSKLFGAPTGGGGGL